MPASISPELPDVVSNITLALAVLNLLLVVVGVLLAYFDWGAARRRELLYLSFTEERPGSNYWDTARRRRGQYSHLLLAFIILIVPRFVPAVSKEVADASQLWLYCLEIVGWVWLAFGFFYSFAFSTRRQAGSVLALLMLVFIAGWFVFGLFVNRGSFGKDASTYVTTAEVAIRFLLVCAVIFLALRYRGKSPQAGLLSFSPIMVAAAFIMSVSYTHLTLPTKRIV